MNWIKENKFVSGFLAAMIVGIAVFGFLLYSSWNQFSEVSDTYNRQASELKRLQSLSPYPDEENLKKMREQKDSYLSASLDLQKRLSDMEFPLEPMEPAAYQDILRKTVSAAVEKATKNGVKLPDKFYGGLEVYQTAPPKDAAAATALGRELKAIELVVNTLLDSRIDAITSLTRTLLPEESAAKPGAPAAGAKPAAKPLVTKHSFTIGFTADQASMRRALNEIASSKTQFLIIRMLRIKNENDKGPPRGDAADLTAGTPVTSGTTAETGAANSLKFVVGNEKLNTLVTIDILDFAPPPKK